MDVSLRRMNGGDEFVYRNHPYNAHEDQFMLDEERIGGGSSNSALVPSTIAAAAAMTSSSSLWTKQQQQTIRPSNLLQQINCNHEIDDEVGIAGPFCPSLENRSVDDLLVFAKLAEKTENYEDMRLFMRCVALRRKSLTDIERGLLSTAYKNVIGTRRSSWRVIWEMEQNELKKEEEEDEAAAKSHRPSELQNHDSSNMVFEAGSLGSLNGISMEELELRIPYLGKFQNQPLGYLARVVRGELEEICLEFINLVDYLLQQDTQQSSETTVFYKKLIGDYYRYLSEYTSDEARREYAKEAGAVYAEALELASTALSPAHKLRLGLALNASVFYFEITNTPDKACELAKTTYDAAVTALQEEQRSSPDSSTPRNNNKETLLLLDLLRENLTIWTLSES